MNHSAFERALIALGICLEVLAFVVGLSGFWSEDIRPVPVLVIRPSEAALPPLPNLPAPEAAPGAPPPLRPTPVVTALPLPAPNLPTTTAPVPLPTPAAAANTPPPPPTAGGWPTPVPWPTLDASPTYLPDYAEVPILLYHYVEDLPPGADPIRQELTISPDQFEAQLVYLSGAGYHTITLDELYLYLTAGRPLPEKPVILTFDDGYRDAYTVVFPLLRKYGFTGNFFVLSAPAESGSPDYLTWEMIAEMAQAGMAMQAHGKDHQSLAVLPDESLLDQVMGSKEALESHIGKPVHFFCYPYGLYDERLIGAVRSAGYLGAVTTDWGRYHYRETFFFLPRMRIKGYEALQGFIEKVEGTWP